MNGLSARNAIGVVLMILGVAVFYRLVTDPLPIGASDSPDVGSLQIIGGQLINAISAAALFIGGCALLAHQAPPRPPEP